MNKNLQNFKAFNLAKASYRACLNLDLPGHLRDQLLRATSSSALNLAEGSARNGSSDKRRFYNISLASIREAQAILVLAELDNSDAEVILDQTAACVYKLLQN
ncbi:MAG: four helix bundle protein, partial [Oligoflexia bacterium]|nr:four helix bundle protein [Oligoflexia bacterium]